MEPDTTRQSPGRTLAILGVGTLAFVLAQTMVILVSRTSCKNCSASP